MNWLIVSLIALGAAMGSALLIWKGAAKHRKADAPRGPAPSSPEPRTDAAADPLAAALEGMTDAMERQRVMTRHVDQAYKRRDEIDMKSVFFIYARAQLDEACRRASELREANNGAMPPIAAFKQMAIALEADGEYAQAIELCRKAMAIGVSDGTKSGFEGRINRLKKKMA